MIDGLTIDNIEIYPQIVNTGEQYLTTVKLTLEQKLPGDTWSEVYDVVTDGSSNIVINSGVNYFTGILLVGTDFSAPGQVCVVSLENGDSGTFFPPGLWQTDVGILGVDVSQATGLLGLSTTREYKLENVDGYSYENILGERSTGKLKIFPDGRNDNIIIPLERNNAQAMLVGYNDTFPQPIATFILNPFSNNSADVMDVVVNNDYYVYVVGGINSLSRIHLNDVLTNNFQQLNSGYSTSGFHDWKGITAFNNGTLLMCGDRGQISRSTDGINWLSQTIGTTQYYWKDIKAITDETAIACGESGIIGVTHDRGITWQTQVLEKGSTRPTFNCVVQGNNGRVFVVGSNNSIAYTDV